MDVGPDPDDAERPVDELLEAVTATQADLALAASSPSLQRDPYRVLLAGLSGTLGVFRLSVSRWERAVAQVIAARDPLPPADRAALQAELTHATEAGAYRAMRAEAARVVRVLDFGLSVRIGLLAGVSLIVGAGGTVAAFAVFHAGPFSPEAQSAADWRDLQIYNPDPRAAMKNAVVTPNGRRAALFWVEPARPPQPTGKP